MGSFCHEICSSLICACAHACALLALRVRRLHVPGRGRGLAAGVAAPVQTPQCRSAGPSPEEAAVRVTFLPWGCEAFEVTRGLPWAMVQCSSWLTPRFTRLQNGTSELSPVISGFINFPLIVTSNHVSLACNSVGRELEKSQVLLRSTLWAWMFIHGCGVVPRK